MKQKYSLILILIFFSIAKYNYSFEGYSKLRFLGGIGFTTGGKVNVGEGSLLDYYAGFQILYHITRNISVGLEISSLHTYTTKYNQNSNILSRSSAENAGYLNTSVVFDLWLKKHLAFFQITAGLYTGISDNKDIGGGFLISTGLEIPLHQYVNLLIANRFEFIFAKHTLIPLSIYTGITVPIY